MQTAVDAKTWDASGPRDPDLSGSDKLLPPDPKLETEAPKFPVQLPEGLDEAKLLSWATRRKKSFEQWFKTQSEKITDSYKMFNSLPVGGMTGSSYVPLVNSVVETDTAKRLGAMFNKLKVVDSIREYSGGAQADNENKILIDDLINQEILSGPSRTPEKAYDAMKAMGIEGTGIGKAFWELYDCVETVPVMAQSLQGPIQVGETKKVSKRGRPNWEQVPLGNMGWDKRLSTHIQDSDYVFQKSFVTMNELLIMQDDGEIANVDEIAKETTASKGAEVDPEIKRKSALGESSSTSGDDGDEGVYRLDEWHALIPYEAPQADGSKRWMHANLRFRIVNDGTLIKCEPNPWAERKNPYFSYRYSILPRQFLGNPVAQPIKQLQVDANNLQTSSTKLVKKAAQNPTFYERASGLDGRKVFIDELSLIPVNDATKIQHFPIDAGAIKAVSEERGFIIDLARETVAANEQAQSIQQGPNGTATEAAIMNQNSGTRFQAVVDLNGWEFFCGIATNFYWLIQKHLQPGDLIVRVSSQDGNPREILPTDVAANYIFVPITSSSVANQQANLQKKMQWAQTMVQQQQQNPMGMQNPDGSFVRFDVASFTIKEIMPLLGIPNGRSYLITTTPQEIQAKAQAQAAMQAPPPRPGMPPQGAPAGGPAPGPADFPLPHLGT